MTLNSDFWVSLSDVFAKPRHWSYNIKTLSFWSTLQVLCGLSRPSERLHILIDTKRLLVVVILRTHYHNKWHSIRVFSSFRYGTYSQSPGIRVIIQTIKAFLNNLQVLCRASQAFWRLHKSAIFLLTLEDY